MPAQVSRCLIKTLFILIISTLAIANARPNHFGESNQVVAEQDSSNLLDSGLKPWQLELLAQRLSEMSSQTGDYPWEKAIRSPESKRQSRYRQCYFNPISCFRK
ncbi:hypothetical protein BDFB_009313 [Asbolus verrucosus]|uniref:Uncharacterized protein n=1 Tax=Asbolus verrucosus TaxID=1661398 RepID=A0A482VIX2_ASBVE|nr:hypothetical protein BDFB_009313 [Asbolus verrucosus]